LLVRLALDTNRYVDFCRGNREVVDRVREAERIYLPFVTLAELRAGFLCGAQARANERVLTRFLNSPRVRVLYADEANHTSLWTPVSAIAGTGHADSKQRHLDRGAGAPA
jgi:predicted nucleic acid-binding protein